MCQTDKYHTTLVRAMLFLYYLLYFKMQIINLFSHLIQFVNF